MKKYRNNILIIIFIFGVISIFLLYKMHNAPTIKELLSVCDRYVIIDTCTSQIIATPEVTSGFVGEGEKHAYPNTTVIEKNGAFYIEARVGMGLINVNKSEIITIEQIDDSYIEPDNYYLVFLEKCDNSDKLYRIVDEPNGLIRIADNGKLIPVNKFMLINIYKEIGFSHSELLEWFENNEKIKIN